MSKEIYNRTRFKEIDYVKAMGTILYCSEHLTDSMIDYFYANGLILGGGHIILLLSVLDGQNGQENDYFNRYERVAVAAAQELDGFFMNYPIEYDGRLCVLLSLRSPIEDENSFFTNLEEICKRIICRCAEEYALSTIAYISPPAKGVEEISRTYEKILVEMEYGSFLSKPSGVINGYFEKEKATESIISIIDYGNAVAETLCGKIISGADHRAEGERILNKLLNIYPHDKSTLRNNYTKIAEQIYLKFIERRLIMPGELSMAEFAGRYLVVTNWQDCENKFLGFLDFVSQSYHAVGNALKSDMARVLAYVNESYTDPNLNVETVGERFMLKPSTLCTTFKKEYGETLFSYVTRLRLDKTMELLNTTNIPVSKIYSQTGFGSVETLNRLFKKRFGTSPGKYRKNVARSV